MYCIIFSSEAEIYLHGGCVTSWKVDGNDLLYLRPDAAFTGEKPIRYVKLISSLFRYIYVNSALACCCNCDSLS